MQRQECRFSGRIVVRLFGPMALVGLLATVPFPAQAAGFSVLKATCGGTVITSGEGLRAGLEDYVDLASVHHGLNLDVTMSSTGPQVGKLNFESLRVVKSLAPSSVRFLERMTKSSPCEQILIDQYVNNPSTGEMMLHWRLELDEAYVSERKEWYGGPEAGSQESLAFFPAAITWSFFNDKGLIAEHGWDFANSTPSTTK